MMNAPLSMQRGVPFTFLLAVMLLCVGLGSEAAQADDKVADDAVTVSGGDLRIVLDTRATSVERRAAELFAANVHERTGLNVQISGDVSTKYALVIGTLKSSTTFRANKKLHAAAVQLKEDGFCLTTVPDSSGRIYVVGQSPSGVVAGVGKLLRVSRYRDGAVEIPAVTLSENPRMPVRGLYTAVQFYNFYHSAPLEELDRVVEELALWGANEVIALFVPAYYKSIDDPEAKKMLTRLGRLSKTARHLGMKFGLMRDSQQVLVECPPPLRATLCPNCWHRDSEPCPSKPEGMKLICESHAKILDAFEHVDMLGLAAYDAGGCGCDKCMPWGGNGFLRVAEQLARVYRERFPEGKLWLLTWEFRPADLDALVCYMREKKPTWFDGILMGERDGSIHKQFLDRPDPERYPLTCFPEITMYRMRPWGGYGANPLAEHHTRIARGLRDHVIGGYPYSEGIFEDINKFFWVQFFWNPDRATDDILAEYAGYYFSPEVVDEAVRLFHLLEETHQRNVWIVYHLDKADEAWSLAETIDARLPERVRSSWRWRLIYIRAAIDHILKNQDIQSDETQTALNAFRRELEGIYHVQEKTHEVIRPAPLPPPPDLNNLALNRLAVASSTHSRKVGSARELVDGIGPDFDQHNYWSHDQTKEKTAWVLIDLGKTTAIRQARLQFRRLGQEYICVPENVSFEVSQDGEQFKIARTTTNEMAQPMDISHDVPEEKSKYSSQFWSYGLRVQGRYLRIKFGPPQSVSSGGWYAGAIQVAEVQVFGP